MYIRVSMGLKQVSDIRVNMFKIHTRSDNSLVLKNKFEPLNSGRVNFSQIGRYGSDIHQIDKNPTLCI